MQTVGLVGIGKIGLPIAENLIKSGFDVLGYRRSPIPEFEQAGGRMAKSPAEVGAGADVVLTCLPSSEALQEVIQGPNGLLQSARPGQIVVELGSHPLSVKSAQIAPLAAKGAAFIDGEVSGTPGMVQARKGVVYLGGDADACKTLEPVIAGFADSCIYFGPFGGASKVKLVNNLLVSVHIAAAAEAMALGLKAGVDPELMIKAVATGSGGSTQFGIRAPWMAEKRFMPVQGSIPLLTHYFDLIGEWADEAGVATPILDRVAALYYQSMDQGYGKRDIAEMVEFMGSLPRKPSAER
jgi:3-hydroxyisobutyrate dehydrogenase